MAYERNGVFLLKRPGKGGEHYGVGVSGWRSGRFGSFSAVAVQLFPRGVAVTPWDESWGPALQAAVDAEAALQRLERATVNTYDFVTQNCEHFARYVVTGTRESRQIQGGLALAALGALILVGTRRR